MGYGASKVADRFKASSMHLHALRWLEKLGPIACLLAWLPLVGDPLCAVAGWLRLPFWRCVFYMAIGKFLRYVALTAALVGVFG
jgi:membrane protein YqaA with SNARE-associated domain